MHCDLLAGLHGPGALLPGTFTHTLHASPPPPRTRTRLAFSGQRTLRAPCRTHPPTTLRQPKPPPPPHQPPTRPPPFSSLSFLPRPSPSPQGRLHVSKRSPLEAVVEAGSGPDAALGRLLRVSGRAAMNRALEGDTVAGR